MKTDFQVSGTNTAAPFTLKLHRGDGMALLAMNWKGGQPPDDFVGFAIECKEPRSDRYFVLPNRLTFSGMEDSSDRNRMSTLRSPIQKFRWVHFPRNAELKGSFTYRVTPVFMDENDSITYGLPQTAEIELQRETYPGLLNVTFTRGFVVSQAFVDKYVEDGPFSTLIPAKAKDGLSFKPTHSKAGEALAWMGFEARHAILEVLDNALADTKAQVKVVAYDLSEREVVSKLVKLGKRLTIIIDDQGEHGEPDSGESQAAKKLARSAGKTQVKRQSMGNLQHNKTIVVDGPKYKTVVCGSTNFSWRGFFVQANNALILSGPNPVKVFSEAFDNYWTYETVKDYGATSSAKWNPLKLKGINAKVAFSPHISSNALLQTIADDVAQQTTSSLFYSLAFLFQTKGSIRDAIATVTKDPDIFVYGISDRKVKDLEMEGLDVQLPDGKVAAVYPSALVSPDLPEPFKSEPSGGSGNRMHHKFLVVDFNKPTARVYLGSYNFSNPADTQNGENLLLIQDRRVAVSYMIEALRLFDHYHFRVVQKEAKKARKRLELKRPPGAREKAWWAEDYTDARKIKDRELFA